MQYIIDKSNINIYLKSGAINTAQAKILGYSSFNAIPKGWKNRRYILSKPELNLFILLGGAKNIKEQNRILSLYRSTNSKI